MSVYRTIGPLVNKMFSSGQIIIQFLKGNCSQNTTTLPIFEDITFPEAEFTSISIVGQGRVSLY